MKTIHGDCLEVMRDMADNSVDAVVTDPPYGLSKEPDIAEVMRHWLAGDVYQHGAKGFMGNSWDSFVPGPEYWREVYRVLKPGGHALVFAGARTQDLMAIAMRFAGFEIRDVIQWIYGMGLPKSLNVSKAVDKMAGTYKRGPKSPNARIARNVPSGCFSKSIANKSIDTPQCADAKKWDGWGTGLKPAYEPILLCRKTIAESNIARNVLKHGTGAINIGGCRVKKGRWPSNVLFSHDERCVKVGEEPEEYTINAYTDGAKPFGNGAGHAYKSEKMQTTREIYACVPSCPTRMLDAQSGITISGKLNQPVVGYGDKGGASRFFYSAKVSVKERNAGLDNFPDRIQNRLNAGGLSSEPRFAPKASKNNHPTLKPISLMRYLCRLITPPDGIVLDPFMGSGTTGCAAALEGFDFIGIEKDETYHAIAQARIAHWRESCPLK